MRRTAVVLALGAIALVVVRPVAQGSNHVVVIEQERGGILKVEGERKPIPGVCRQRQPGPLRAKYRGRVELRLGSDGTIRIVNRLTFSEYLRGLAEVPASWHEQALRAQAIAARSYGLDALRRAPAGRSYDICATDRCQVYRGAVVELGAFGERWVDAVESTSGNVLTYGRRVIQAFYFSTSTGRTERSFPGGSPQPWLPSVDGEDSDSPLARWRARIPLQDLAAILDEAGDWPGGSITSVSQDGDEVTLRGPGRVVRLERNDLRIAVNNEAPCVFPGRYPTVNRNTGRPLPLTIPSSTYQIARDGSSAVVSGRGWGHGVGMSQYGARSLAERGRDAREILGHFYGPARVEDVDEPGAIRVLAAESLRHVRLEADGPLRVRVGGDRTQVPERFGVEVAGDVLRIRPGEGPSSAPVLRVEATRRSLRAAGGERARIPVTLSRASRVRAVVRDAAGDVVRREPERSYEIGEQKVAVTLVGRASIPLVSGRYRATVEAYDGYDRVRSEPVTLVVAAAPTPVPSPLPSPTARAIPAAEDADRTGLVAAGAAAAVIALGVWLALRRPWNRAR